VLGLDIEDGEDPLGAGLRGELFIREDVFLSSGGLVELHRYSPTRLSRGFLFGGDLLSPFSRARVFFRCVLSPSSIDSWNIPFWWGERGSPPLFCLWGWERYTFPSLPPHTGSLGERELPVLVGL